jgi:uncharacterized RDD family membrane protein YckC
MNFFPTIASLLNKWGPDAAGLFLLFGVFGVGFFLWMVVDCALNETPENKLVWLLIIICVPLGSFIYYFVRERRRA